MFKLSFDPGKLFLEIVKQNKFTIKSDYERDLVAYQHVIWKVRNEHLAYCGKLKREFKEFLNKNICCEKKKEEILRNNNIFD